VQLAGSNHFRELQQVCDGFARVAATGSRCNHHHLQAVVQGNNNNSIIMVADTSIEAEVLSKHGHSAQPESQQLVAVLHALKDAIQAEGLATSPTSYFAAGMSALEKPETRASPQVLAAAPPCDTPSPAAALQ
jgi:hypothetical protein